MYHNGRVAEEQRPDFDKYLLRPLAGLKANWGINIAGKLADFVQEVEKAEL